MLEKSWTWFEIAPFFLAIIVDDANGDDKEEDTLTSWT
jgi:hypothetical protein